MGACREITICYDYTFPGETVNFTGESIYSRYIWNENVPNPLLFTTTITKCLERHGTWMSSTSLHCCQPRCTQYNSQKSQLQLSATSLGKKQIEAKSKLKSHVERNHDFLLNFLHCSSLHISWPPKVSDFNIKIM